MIRSTASNESATLSRELSEFLIELSIALHKHAIYPEGHPLLASSEAGLTLRLSALLEERGTLSLGVARQQLVIEGVATDPANPLLRELAQRLHRHHLGAVKFARGVADAELADLLRTLTADAARAETPLGLGPPEALRRWTHIRLFSLTFEHLELLEEEDERDESELRDGHRFRAAQLWVGLARAALAAEGTGDANGHTPASADPTMVARAIEEHSREQAYDQVIVGYLLQIAGELQQGGGAETAALRRRVSRMVSSLRPETLRQLLQMGGDAAQRQRFVLEAAQGMAVDAVVELVRAAAETSGQSISHSLIRLFNKLAANAEHGAVSQRLGSEHALRENVRRLVEGWALPDPNPGAYRKVLEGMSRHTTAPMQVAVEFDTEPERLLEISLELGAVSASTRGAVDLLVNAGRTGDVLALLNAPAGDASAKERLWAHLATEKTLRTLLDAPQLDVSVIERVVARMGMTAADLLLDGIERAEERTARWKLLDLLAMMGAEIGVRATARLQGAPWYVQRNLLVLLSRLPELPEGFSPVVLAENSDARVRREAIKLQLRTPSMRERALLSGLADPDPRVVHLALGAASEDCPLPAAPALLSALRGKRLDDEMRVFALRALSQLRLPNVLEELIRHVEGRRGFLGIGARSLATKSPAMLAALAGLAAHWGSNARAKGILALARASADAEICAAASPGPTLKARSIATPVATPAAPPIPGPPTAPTKR